MEIHVVTGKGSGPTKLAAFDSALNDAGVANFNLIRLSSVVPPGSEIIIHQGKKPKIKGEWGDRLYVVMADMRVDTPNTEAWAGIGWAQDKKTGQGLFVEHEGNNEATVRRDITQSLKALMETRKIKLGPIKMHVVGKVCEHTPVCALALAAFISEGWEESDG